MTASPNSAECSGSVGRALSTLDGRVASSRLTAGRQSLCYVLEQNTLSATLVLVQLWKTCPDMTEKLLTGTYRIKTNNLIYLMH